MRELDAELEIAGKTRDIAQDGLRLTTLRHDRGAVTGLDVHQSEQFLFTATAQIASIERQIALAKNQISLLLGRDPGEIERGKTLNDLTGPAQVPAGLPSELLERRPDIRQAEDSLIAANAQIGAARAQSFPQITLTGLLGVQSGLQRVFLMAETVNSALCWPPPRPFLNAGCLRANVRIAKAQQKEAR